MGGACGSEGTARGDLADGSVLYPDCGGAYTNGYVY